MSDVINDEHLVCNEEDENMTSEKAPNDSDDDSDDNFNDSEEVEINYLLDDVSDDNKKYFEIDHHFEEFDCDDNLLDDIEIHTNYTEYSHDNILKSVTNKSEQRISDDPLVEKTKASKILKLCVKIRVLYERLSRQLKQALINEYDSKKSLVEATIRNLKDFNKAYKKAISDLVWTRCKVENITSIISVSNTKESELCNVNINDFTIARSIGHLTLHAATLLCVCGFKSDEISMFVASEIASDTMRVVLSKKAFDSAHQKSSQLIKDQVSKKELGSYVKNCNTKDVDAYMSKALRGFYFSKRENLLLEKTDCYFSNSYIMSVEILLETTAMFLETLHCSEKFYEFEQNAMDILQETLNGMTELIPTKVRKKLTKKSIKIAKTNLIKTVPNGIVCPKFMKRILKFPSLIYDDIRVKSDYESEFSHVFWKRVVSDLNLSIRESRVIKSFSDYEYMFHRQTKEKETELEKSMPKIYKFFILVKSVLFVSDPKRSQRMLDDFIFMKEVVISNDSTTKTVIKPDSVIYTALRNAIIYSQVNIQMREVFDDAFDWTSVFYTDKKLEEGSMFSGVDFLSLPLSQHSALVLSKDMSVVEATSDACLIVFKWISSVVDYTDVSGGFSVRVKSLLSQMIKTTRVVFQQKKTPIALEKTKDATYDKMHDNYLISILEKLKKQK